MNSGYHDVMLWAAYFYCIIMIAIAARFQWCFMIAADQCRTASGAFLTNGCLTTEKCEKTHL
jgi:hypothetical protein